MKEGYPILEEEYLTLSKTWLVGTKEFTDALEETQDILA
jgi:hypothetical protein